jgi:hypothetical protein
MKRVFIVLFFISTICFSQKIDKQNAKFTVRGNIGIPRTISSSMFQTAFSGVAEGNLSFNVRLFNNFFVGLGYQMSYFQNNKFLKFQYFNNSIPYNTRFTGNGGFVKLGYDQFFSEKGYMSYSINSGVMQYNYSFVNLDTNINNKPYGKLLFLSPYVQPEISANFIVDNTLSFSIMLSYTTVFDKFDPKSPRFNHFNEIRSASNKYYMSWLNIGFGFNVLINSKSKSTATTE